MEKTLSVNCWRLWIADASDKQVPSQLRCVVIQSLSSNIKYFYVWTGGCVFIRVRGSSFGFFWRVQKLDVSNRLIITIIIIIIIGVDVSGIYSSNWICFSVIQLAGILSATDAEYITTLVFNKLSSVILFFPFPSAQFSFNLIQYTCQYGVICNCRWNIICFPMDQGLVCLKN